MREARNMDEDRYRSYVIAGDPDAVCEQVAAFFDAGLDGLVFNMNDAQALEPVRLAGTTLSRAFG
jgi:alkanesulfonate monooxygenase SsuD/methylene tetrahydromethanopterin reductase-like flavin-dependent oxidoreductase (luciferase family)